MKILHKKFIQNIFSVKNQNLYKVITILGLKIKILRKNKIKKNLIALQKKLCNVKQENMFIKNKIYNFAEFISHYNKEPIIIVKQDYHNNEIYNKDFYKSQAKESYHSAQIVINILKKYYNPKSILDLGCGVGTWLKAWQDSGVERILGVDVNEMPENVLYIPRNNLKIFDFENIQGIVDFGQFDMAMSLECFEHIASEKCGYALDILTNASNLIMFSAAIPYQSGTNHINCRHLQYWVEQFKKRGYACYDIIRPECIRQNLSIASWYEQNILIFAKDEKANILEENGAIAVANPVMFYHNEILKSILYSFNESKV